MAGWKDDQDRTLDELQDWSKVNASARGFGNGSGSGKPPTQTGGSGGGEKPPEPPKTLQVPAGDEGGTRSSPSVPKRPGKGEPAAKIEGTGGSKPPEPPRGRTGGGGPMEPKKSPWIEVSDDWLDNEYSAHSGYRAFQEYFNLKAKPSVINEYLLGEGICPTSIIEIEEFTASEASGKLICDGRMKVTGPLKQGGIGTDYIDITRTFNKADNECSFDLMGASIVRIEDFGVEYYRRVIPLLRKLDIATIKTHPTTGADYSQDRHRLVSAYIWSFYGYSNDNMAGTLNQYIEWLKNVKGLNVTRDQQNKILSTTRMLDLAQDRFNGEMTGKKFLLGMDAQDKPMRTLGWSGTHHNINDESSQNEEMTELIRYLLRKMK